MATHVLSKKYMSYTQTVYSENDKVIYLCKRSKIM